MRREGRRGGSQAVEEDTSRLIGRNERGRRALADAGHGDGGWALGRGADRGSATVWSAMAAGALCVVFAAVLALGQAVAARHRAGGAADLAALAAADRALRGAEDACEAAARVARAQHAEVVACSLRGEVAEVTARARFGPYAPAVRSRAGPPEAWPEPGRREASAEP
ncbi:Rv3654c family TadE-like protein [Streptomyces thermolilacinus]